MTTALLDVATFIFVSVMILFCVVLLLSVTQRRATKYALRRKFKYYIIAALAIYLLHLLSRESINNFGSSSKALLRWDCLRSDKGGKRPFGIESEEYKHPCYDTVAAVAEDEVDDLTPSSPKTNLCYSSTSTNTKYEQYISAARDCQANQRFTCSLSEPCTPCEISRRDEFPSTWTRCQSCSIRNNFGDCNFQEGQGPYCWKDGDMVEVVPCEICCTDNKPMFEKDGVCY